MADNFVGRRRHRHGRKRQTAYRTFELSPVALPHSKDQDIKPLNADSSKEDDLASVHSDSKENLEGNNIESLQSQTRKPSKNKASEQSTKLSQDEFATERTAKSNKDEIAESHSKRVPIPIEEKTNTLGNDKLTKPVKGKRSRQEEYTDESDADVADLNVKELFPYLKLKTRNVRQLEDKLKSKSSKELSWAEQYQKYKIQRVREKNKKKVTDLGFVYAVVKAVVTRHMEKCKSLKQEDREVLLKGLKLYAEEVKRELDVYLQRGEEYFRVISEHRQLKQDVAQARQEILEEEKGTRMLEDLLTKETTAVQEKRAKVKSDEAALNFVEAVKKIVDS